MPSRFVRRYFRADSIYHIFNRGAYKNEIFREESDYRVFRRILEKTWKSMDNPPIFRTYVLMPNHFHFRLYQAESTAISKYMKSCWVKYTMYFSKKYNHSGCICQGRFKAIWLRTRQENLRVHKYILENPAKAGLVNWPHVGIRPW